MARRFIMNCVSGQALLSSILQAFNFFVLWSLGKNVFLLTAIPSVATVCYPVLKMHPCRCLLVQRGEQLHHCSTFWFPTYIHHGAWEQNNNPQHHCFQPAIHHEPMTATKRAPTLSSFTPSDSSLQFRSCRLDKKTLAQVQDLSRSFFAADDFIFRLEPETSAIVSNGKKKVVISQKWRG